MTGPRFRQFFVAFRFRVMVWKKSGRVRALNTFAALTTNHLPTKGESWLPISVLQVPARNLGDSQFSLSASLKSKEKLSKTWKQTRMQSRSISATKQHSPLKLIPSTSFTQSYQIGKLETRGVSRNGHPFTANPLCLDGRSSFIP